MLAVLLDTTARANALVDQRWTQYVAPPCPVLRRRLDPPSVARPVPVESDAPSVIVYCRPHVLGCERSEYKGA